MFSLRSLRAICLATILGTFTPIASASYTVEGWASANYRYDTVHQSTGGALPQASVYLSAAQNQEASAWSSVQNGELKAHTFAILRKDAEGSTTAASAWVRWTDTITVSGAGNPGDPVQLQLTYRVHGSVYSGRDQAYFDDEYGWTRYHKDAWGMGSIEITNQRYGQTREFYYSGQVDYNFAQPAPETDYLTAVVNTYIGDTLTLRAYLNSQVFTGVTWYEGPEIFARADFGNTATVNLESLTPGASFSSASGATYAAVPEPALGGVFIGLLGLMAARRRGH